MRDTGQKIPEYFSELCSCKVKSCSCLQTTNRTERLHAPQMASYAHGHVRYENADSSFHCHGGNQRELCIQSFLLEEFLALPTAVARMGSASVSIAKSVGDRTSSYYIGTPSAS